MITDIKATYEEKDGMITASIQIGDEDPIPFVDIKVTESMSAEGRGKLKGMIECTLMAVKVGMLKSELRQLDSRMGIRTAIFHMLEMTAIVVGLRSIELFGMSLISLITMLASTYLTAMVVMRGAKR